MSDLISRKDAKEALQTEKRTEERTETHACDCISRQTVREHFYMYVPGLAWDKIDAIIDDIPSAQPEIIRCKDCKHWDGVDTCDVIDAPVWDNDFCSLAERRSHE